MAGGSKEEKIKLFCISHLYKTRENHLMLFYDLKKEVTHDEMRFTKIKKNFFCCVKKSFYFSVIFGHVIGARQT